MPHFYINATIVMGSRSLYSKLAFANM